MLNVLDIATCTPDGPSASGHALAAADRLVVREAVVADDVLFIVPWPWAGTGIAFENASKTTSVMRLDVSVFPAATAAGEARVDEAALGRAHGDRARTRRRTPAGQGR